MIEKFKSHISNNFPYLEGKKLLLATSGGMDSMVMAQLFKKLGFEIALAHCNFQLRGLESFDDQNFVQNYAVNNNIEIFITQFDTTAFANDFKFSIQVAARELRYNWFYELIETKKFDYILTAHHADDNIETFLIHLVRGSGLEGFTGIPIKNGSVIRPLLAFSREQISNYASANDILWREDSSNASDKYLRNKIRHDLVPILKELNPNFISSFQKTQSHLNEAQEMVEDATIMIYQQVANEIDDEIHFDINQLKKLPNFKSYLYQWLKEFGFSAWDDIYDLVDSQSGKQVFSDEFRLLKDRHFLILCPINKIDETEEYFINENQKVVNLPIKLSICNKDYNSNSDNSVIFVDADKLQYPLVLRRFIKGDIFEPFGMNGKSKKVSKLFKDEKMSLFQKENTWLLCSENKIVWVVGIRQDERFKLEKTTKNSLQIALL
ncbi:MAG: tRNA lysidine(34) synthetase TilS [Bacteroidota bacterium]|jgi:tRNA(Ile)-lysidine synthase